MNNLFKDGLSALMGKVYTPLPRRVATGAAGAAMAAPLFGKERKKEEGGEKKEETGSGETPMGSGWARPRAPGLRGTQAWISFRVSTR